MEKDLSLLEKKIKYNFKDISLLKLALTHSSFEKTHNNEWAVLFCYNNHRFILLRYFF